MLRLAALLLLLPACDPGGETATASEIDTQPEADPEETAVCEASEAPSAPHDFDDLEHPQPPPPPPAPSLAPVQARAEASNDRADALLRRLREVHPEEAAEVATP